jgi:hypothetical protein
MILVITKIMVMKPLSMNQTPKQPIGVAYGIYDHSVINCTLPSTVSLYVKNAWTLTLNDQSKLSTNYKKMTNLRW